jgi:predicted amidohydrolase
MNMTVSIVQMAVATADPETNLKKGESWIAEAARRGSELVCFPELWTTGFNWTENERLAPAHERVIARIGALAARYGLWINGSLLALNERGQVSNASVLFDDAGRIVGTYRKTHLFTLIHEEAHMAPGDALCTVETPWGKTGLAICYDIRFPELFRTYALKGVRFILTPAAFPAPRRQHWKTLLRARAIENQMFMIGVNQSGREDFGPDGVVAYGGASAIIDPWGEAVIEAGDAGEALLTATIDLDRVKEVRNRMRVLDDRRPELYELG